MNHTERTTNFIKKAIVNLCNLDQISHLKVLDFGCGKGNLVNALFEEGYDTYGCDIEEYWMTNSTVDATKFKLIPLAPYTLPYPDNYFDVVISITVMEHAQNKEEIFKEIHRVLKPGGYSMHLFPSKWYLPSEPHIYVPLVNCFWPKVPKWYLSFWALLGIRNEFQTDLPWQEVAKRNYNYCQTGLCYQPNGKYRQISEEIFGNYSSPMDFYLKYSEGGVSKILNKLPFKNLSGWLNRTFRNQFILMFKTT